MKIVARMSPTTILYFATLFAVLWVSIILLLAIRQPYLGLVFSPHEQSVIIKEIKTPHMPQHFKENAVLSISSSTGEIQLQSVDLTIEPDSTMKTYADYRHFLNRQAQIHTILKNNEHLTLTFVNQESLELPIAPVRPILSLDVSFWIQIFVGITSWLITAAIFAFRTNTIAARYLLLSGFSTLLFTTFAAVYTTRELAIDANLFQFLSDYNFFGGSLYIACFIALLLYYPRKIAPTWLGFLVISIYVIWFIAQQRGFFVDMSFARRILVMIGLICSLGLTILHWQFSKRNPVERAALQWFLLSWIFGISLFAIFILLPTLFGIDTSALQGYAFLLILMVYIGLALGILRYRLFELDRWWGRTILLLVAIVVLLLMDIALINVLHMAPKHSLVFSVVFVGILILPMRIWIWEKLLKQGNENQSHQFKKIINIALSSQDQNYQNQWTELFQNQYQPLNILIDNQIDSVKITQDGLSLHIPAIEELPALTIQYAGQGRRLFSSQDIEDANEICEMLKYALNARQAYEAGTIEERKRISRDLHDNVGSQLVSALHQTENAHKNEMIRTTLMDLRQIINNNLQSIHALDELLANLRQETSQQLEIVNIQLEWQLFGDSNIHAPIELMHSLRSIIREASHNIIRHANATQASVFINIQQQSIQLTIKDNGQGVPASNHEIQDYQEGHGLQNMRTRAKSLGGNITYTNLFPGFSIYAELPLDGAQHA
ncbi:ATP-binding protein [Acinetobacter sp. A3.8]|uniref:histidine kinase n=1 Tax=Acinetobacter sedimenti TaxID=2919922 RepID=A0A9X1WWD5_9GAMM|nr:ATP-binding protein [Acinetobacter sedimenti]MCJ8145738.1 ATP-binding protein [Acinetobacter sedimenti]